MPKRKLNSVLKAWWCRSCLLHLHHHACKTPFLSDIITLKKTIMLQLCFKNTGCFMQIFSGFLLFKLTALHALLSVFSKRSNPGRNQPSHGPISTLTIGYITHDAPGSLTFTVNWPHVPSIPPRRPLTLHPRHISVILLQCGTTQDSIIHYQSYPSFFKFSLHLFYSRIYLCFHCTHFWIFGFSLWNPVEQHCAFKNYSCPNKLLNS